MPTKESKTKVEKAEQETKKSSSKNTATKKAPTKKTTTTKAKSTVKKDETTKKKTSTKKTETATKISKSKASAEKKSTKPATSTPTKKAATKKTATKGVTKTTKRKSTSVTKKTSKPKLETEKKIQILEYYDLPYRYNETIVKILAQTPNILFVYWDIADNDRINYELDHGQYFFNDTYPVLIVHNITKNYYEEVPINDFANSWYLNLEDANCEYNIELGRRYKEYATRNPDIKIPNDNFIHVTNSNDLVMPNDHILFEQIKPEIQYRNVKTGENFTRKISDILINDSLQPIKDFYELYKNIYQVDHISPFFFDLNNPSSGNPTSTFK